MTEPAQHLIKQLADPLTHRSARERLIEKGALAVDELLSALDQDLPLSQQKDIMRILLEVNDCRCVHQFRKALASDDEEIRAISATGLFRLGSPDALEACLATINDAPDMLHYDLTPSVRALSEMGCGVLSAIIPLLSDENERTRQHAQSVLERVTFNEMSKTKKLPQSANRVKSIWKSLWEANGSYRWDAPMRQRQSAIKRWQNWLARYSGE